MDFAPDISPDATALLSGGASLSDAYRRSARRLRAQFHNQPGKLQLALRELVRTVDARRPTAPVRNVEKPVEQDVSDITQVFARHVSAAFDGPILRFSQRLRLLQQSDQIGIPRFKAHLIIATVQRDKDKR